MPLSWRDPANLWDMLDGNLGGGRFSPAPLDRTDQAVDTTSAS